MALKTTLFDPADYLTTPEHCAIFLTEALKTGDVAYVAHAIGVVARASGMADIAKKAGLSREGLYRTLSEKGNPELATILKVLEAVGLDLVIKPHAKTARKPKTKTAATRRKAA